MEHCWIALIPEPCPRNASAWSGGEGASGQQHAIGCWALQFTPRVALVEEAVALEVRASFRLFGGEAVLRSRVHGEAQRSPGGQAVVKLTCFLEQCRALLPVPQPGVRAGRLHVGSFSTGPTSFAVNIAGAVPFAVRGTEKGFMGYQVITIVKKDSPYQKLSDLKGKRVAHVAPSSNSGHMAPLALFPKEGLTPEQDYKLIFSGKHDQSIMGVAIGAAGVILSGTFASLMLAGNSLLVSMGFALSFGIAVAAFVMSMFFTPALTALLGHAAWWPGHGDEKKPEKVSETVSERV